MPRLNQSLTATLLTCGIAATAASLTGGCASGDATEKSGSAAVAGLDLDTGVLGYRQSWIGVAPISGSPSQVKNLGENVGVVDGRGNLILLAGSTGAFRWTGVNPNAYTKVRDVLPTARGYALVDEGEVIAFAADTGELTARQQVARVVSTSVAGVGPLVMYGSSGGELCAHDARLGFKAWSYHLGAPVLSAPVAIIDRLVGVVAQDGSVFVVDAASGSTVGTARTAGGQATDPVAGEGLMFIASLDQSLYAISADPAVRIKWRMRTETPLNRQPMYAAGRVFLTVPGKGLTAVNAASGKPDWINDKLSGNPIAVRGANVIIRSGEELTAVEMATGRTVGSVKVPGLVQASGGSAEGPLLLALRDGRVIKLVSK
jgi:outer membrane protein assembly factor BamB